MEPRQDGIGFFSLLDPRYRLFDDRTQAGADLAQHLDAYREPRPLVLGIPRGGVPVAAEVARRLDADLDVIVARKLGAPGHEELAIGAVTSSGARFLNDEVIAYVGATDRYLDAVTSEQRAEAERRERRFRAGLPPIDARDRVVILVDDGLATGATMRAAILGLRDAGARRVVVAVPVAPVETCEAIAREVDDLVCPHRPEPFFAVGAHYRAFDQVTDDEVERALREHRDRGRSTSTDATH